MGFWNVPRMSGEERERARVNREYWHGVSIAAHDWLRVDPIQEAAVGAYRADMYTARERARDATLASHLCAFYQGFADEAVTHLNALHKDLTDDEVQAAKRAVLQQTMLDVDDERIKGGSTRAAHGRPGQRKP